MLFEIAYIFRKKAYIFAKKAYILTKRYPSDTLRIHCGYIAGYSAKNPADTLRIHCGCICGGSADALRIHVRTLYDTYFKETQNTCGYIGVLRGFPADGFEKSADTRNQIAFEKIGDFVKVGL